MASQSSDALPIQFPTGAYFYLSLGVAVLAVILFAKNKFDEPSVDRSEDDFICQLLPRYLATGEEYSKGLAFYIGAMIITVIVLSLLGPNVLQLGGANVPNDADIHNTIPIFVALVLVGVLPNLPMLKEIEQRLRRMAHEIAYIPAAARATAEKLASAAFDFSWYNTQEVLTAPEMRGVEIADFERPRGSLEYSWVRLSCLVYQLKVHRISGDLESLDGELLQRYAAVLDNIEDKRKSLEADVAESRR